MDKKFKIRPTVYVAGPISSTNLLDGLANIRQGIIESHAILIAGFAPFSPFIDFQFMLTAGHVDLETLYEYSLSQMIR